MSILHALLFLFILFILLQITSIIKDRPGVIEQLFSNQRMSTLKKVRRRIRLLELIHDHLVELLRIGRCVALSHQVPEIRTGVLLVFHRVVLFAFVKGLFEHLAAHFA